MSHAWIDAQHGIAGDMLLGALVDAGAKLEGLQAAVDAVIPNTVELGVAEVKRCGMRAAKVEVAKVAEDQHHRHWSTIRELIGSADLPDQTKSWSLSTFERLAMAESRAHGIPMEEVHFHEVGAWDSIADVVGCCAALTQLGVTSVTAGAPALGSGVIQAAHGQIPVPVPAVANLAEGWPVTSGGVGELTTPTGMALLAALATPAAGFEGTLGATGVGAGTKDFEDHPNVTRVLLGQQTTAGLTNRLELTSNIDDLDPRVWPSVLSALLAAGADDAWLAPIIMKRGRPAQTLHVLCRPELEPSLRDLIYRHTPTLGIRTTQVARHELDRDWVSVEVHGQEIRIKRGWLAGEVVTATPELADAEAAAGQLGLPLDAVVQLAREQHASS